MELDDRDDSDSAPDMFTDASEHERQYERLKLWKCRKHSAGVDVRQCAHAYDSLHEQVGKGSRVRGGVAAALAATSPSALPHSCRALHHSVARADS